MDNKMIGFIAEEYKQLNKQRREHQEDYQKYLYGVLPEVEYIDNEISSLALNCANQVVKGLITVEEAFEQMERRRDALNAKKAAIMAKANVNSYKPLPYKCNLCNDTGKIGEEMCTCYKQKVRKYMIEAAKSISNFSCDIDKDTFANASMQYYSRNVIPKLGISAYEYMKAVIGKCAEYCKTFGNDSDNLFFAGEPGRGKTFMANCIANELLSRGHSVIYQTAYKLFQFLEDYKFGKLDREAFEETYKAIYDCDMLIIDDLGTEYITAYTCSVFFDVLNSRLLNNKKTIISTNLNIGDMSKNYTDRVGSRIKGEFGVFHFIGDDIRVLKRNTRK